nr:glycosyltransferase family 4 protein [Bacteroides intestinalis]
MKTILIITAVFPPEPIVSSRLSFDIVDNLKKDYKIVVLHPYPTRPYGFSFDRKVIKTEHYEDILLDSYVCPQSKILGRFYESYSFGLQCKKYIARYWTKFSCIYVNSWPLFSQALIVKTAKKYRIPCILHVQDIYPESFTNKMKCRFVSYAMQLMLLPIDKYILNNASHVLVISSNMKNYLLKKRKVDETKISVVENWQNEDEFIAYENRKSLNVDSSVLSFMYLGNIGPVAGIEFLINSFAKAQLKRTRLIIAGSGSRKQACIELAGRYKNVVIEFKDVPNGKVPEVQSEADIMLLPLKKGAAMSSIPSKLPAYMFSKKPIIGSLDVQSDTARAIIESDCGLVVEPENEQALINAFKEAVHCWNFEVLKRKGENGFDYAMKRFSRKHNLSLVTKIIKEYAF